MSAIVQAKRGKTMRFDACFLLFHYQDSPEETTKLQVKLTRYCESYCTVLNANIYPNMLLVGSRLFVLRRQELVQHERVVKLSLLCSPQDSLKTFFESFHQAISTREGKSLVILVEADKGRVSYQLATSLLEKMIRALKRVHNI